MLTCPVSGMSSVESIRISVDLPEPLEPRMPTISRRLMVMLTLSTARTSRLASFCPSFCVRQRNKERDFLNILVTPSMTTAFSVKSMAISSIVCVSTSIAMSLRSSFAWGEEHYPNISSSIMDIFDRENRLRPVHLYKKLDPHRYFLRSLHNSARI